VTVPADWVPRISEAIGPPERIEPLGSAWRIEAGGHSFVVKSGPGCRDECDGLLQIGALAGAPPVPDVVLVEDDLLVTAAIPQRRRHEPHEVHLGRSLARMHTATVSSWGGGSAWIGSCQVDPAARSEAAAFYGARLEQLAARCGLEDVVGSVVPKLGDRLPSGGPVLVHGDLWWGNVLFGSDDRSWVIDPSVHGGHPEEELAMLALFGGVPDRLIAAYDEVRPLEPGWEERVALFQLSPLLVHAVLFGGGYRNQAEAVARRYA
jgi:fructosamine-3-kinase